MKILFSFFCSLLLYFGFFSDNKPDYDYYFTKSRSYFDKNNYSACILMMDSAIALEPNRDSSYTIKGHAYIQLYRPLKAIEQVDKALSLNPKNHYAYYIKGIAISFINLASDTLLMDSIATIMKKHKNDLEWKRNNIFNRYYVSDGNYGMYDYKKAIDYVTKAIQTSPVKFFFYYSRRAYLYSMLHLNDSALADYKTAIELSPNNAFLYSELGKLCENRGEHYEANYNYTQGIKYDSSYAELYYLRGKLYQTRWHDKEYACKDFRKATMLGKYVEDMDEYCKITWYDSTMRFYDIDGRLFNHRHDFKSSCFCPKYNPETDTLIEEIDPQGFKRTILDIKPSEKTTWQFDDGRTIEISKKTKERWLKDEEEKRNKQPNP